MVGLRTGERRERVGPCYWRYEDRRRIPPTEVTIGACMGEAAGPPVTAGLANKDALG